VNPSYMDSDPAERPWGEVHTFPGKPPASQLTWFGEIRSTSSFYSGQQKLQLCGVSGHASCR